MSSNTSSLPPKISEHSEKEWTVEQETSTMANLLCGGVELAHLPKGAAATIAAAHKASLASLREDKALEKALDAERLDWLEETASGLEVQFNEDTGLNEWWVEETWELRRIKNTARQAIDAAMEDTSAVTADSSTASVISKDAAPVAQPWWAPKLTREYMESGAAPVAQSDGAHCREELVRLVKQIGQWDETDTDLGPQEPRGETWHQERANWHGEVMQLRKHISVTNGAHVLQKIMSVSWHGCRANCLYCGEVNELASHAFKPGP